MMHLRRRGIMARRAAKTLTYLQHTGDDVDRTTYTFSSINFGTADPDRYIIVGATSRAAGTATLGIVSVTVGGVAATQCVQRENSPTNGDVAGLYVAPVPTGTSGNVVVVFNQAMLRCGIDLWSAKGISTTPLDADSSIADPGVATLDTVNDGILVAVTITGGPTAGWVWTNATERYDGFVGTGENAQSSAADATGTTAGTRTVTANLGVAAVEPVTVFASW